ncbi:MAG: leucine-rich repeat protein, partial [Lachnospiraceae bacterium]|nr:leucine-rich repeat protein [Lachnospiraceae bacterium]
IEIFTNTETSNVYVNILTDKGYDIYMTGGFGLWNNYDEDSGEDNWCEDPLKEMVFFSLEKITIGADVTRTIDGSLVSGSTELTEVVVEEGNTLYTTKDGMLYDSTGEELLIFPVCATNEDDYSATIPDGVETVGAYALAENCYAESVIVPASVTEVKAHAFDGIEDLVSFTFNGTTPPSFGEGCFDNIPDGFAIYVPEGSEDDYAQVISDSLGIDLSEYIKTIGSSGEPIETATSEVTESPEETATAEVTESPEETATAEVTESPEETATAEVTESPEETESVEPSEEPSEEPSASTEPSEEPSEEPFTFTAMGNKVDSITGSGYYSLSINTGGNNYGYFTGSEEFSMLGITATVNNHLFALPDASSYVGDDTNKVDFKNIWSGQTDDVIVATNAEGYKLICKASCEGNNWANSGVGTVIEDPSGNQEVFTIYTLGFTLSLASDPIEPSASPETTESPESTESADVTESPAETESADVTESPAETESVEPSVEPSVAPSEKPSEVPSDVPSEVPSDEPSIVPSDVPSMDPSIVPSEEPSESAETTESPAESESAVPTGSAVVPTSSAVTPTESAVVPSTSPSASTEPTVSPSTEPSVIGKTFTYKNAKYKILTKNTVALVKVTKKSLKKFVIPPTVKYQGVTYKVVKINANAFKNLKKMKNVTIGKNVKTITAKAFVKCNKLSKITIKSKVIKSIGKNAFAGVKKKCVVICPKAKKKVYTKLFKKAKATKRVKLRFK